MLTPENSIPTFPLAHESFFEDMRFREATRLIVMKFRLIAKEKIRFLQVPKTVASDPWCPSLYFTGSSMDKRLL
jgi:hypothetical protein